MNEEYSIIDYLHYLSKKDIDDSVRKSCDTTAKRVESFFKDRNQTVKVISLLDGYFAMYTISWILSKWGENHYIGNTKIQKIAFLTNYKEYLSGRQDVGFGEPFISYHYGPWSLSLQLDIEMLRALGFLKIRKDNESLTITAKGKLLASSYEDFLGNLEYGKSFISNLSESTELISHFYSTQEMLDYFYSLFPIFNEIRDRCITVSSRINGQIRIANIILESVKGDV